MKKYISIIVAIVLLFTLSACSSKTVVSYSAAWGRTNVNETSTYKVTVQKAESSSDSAAPRLNGEGTYVSTITGDNDEGYTVTTSFVFEGYYEFADGTKKDVNDTVETTVRFKNAGYSFAPISSERKYNGSTIEYDQKTDSYAISPLSFTSTVEYGEKNIAIKNVGSDLLTSDLTLKTPTKSVYFDNEEIIYVIRGMINDTVYDSGFSTSVSVISGLSTEVMSFGIQAQKNTTEDVVATIDGVSKVFECYRFYLYKTSGNTGAALNYYFAKGDTGEVNVGEGKREVDRSRLIKMTQNIAYSEDLLVFELISYDYK